MDSELFKWDLVNSANSIKELQMVITEKLADDEGFVEGRKQKWDAKEQAGFVRHCIEGIVPFYMLTRSYGIRQQALYLQHYNKL